MIQANEAQSLRRKGGDSVFVSTRRLLLPKKKSCSAAQKMSRFRPSLRSYR
jgi:hypothetical protein